MNVLFWYTYNKSVIVGYDDEDGKYITLERALNQAKEQEAASNKYLKVEVETEMKNHKDIYSGKSETKTTHYKKVRTRVEIKQITKYLAEYLERPEFGQRFPQLLDVHMKIKKYSMFKQVDPDIPFLFIIKPFMTPNDWSHMYRVIEHMNNVIVYKDEDNFIMTHNKKLLVTTRNGNPGFAIGSSILRGLHNKLTIEKTVIKDIKIKSVTLDKELLKCPYYKKLAAMDFMNNTVFNVLLVQRYKERFHKTKDLLPLAIQHIEQHQTLFNVLDVTLPRDVKGSIEEFIYKMYFIQYIKSYGNVMDYLEKVNSEYYADHIVHSVNTIFKSQQLDISDLYDGEFELITIEHNKKDGDYVMVDDVSMSLKDSRDPHAVYLEEEEASASPASPLFDYDYEVKFEELEGEL